jgi:hypothetical protein
MEIPGWAPIAKKRLKGCPGAQLVNGQWYMPSLGCDSLEAALEDLYLDAVLALYYYTTFDGKGGQRFGYGKTGDEAIAVLREFGIVDEMGHVVEGVSRGGS